MTRATGRARRPPPPLLLLVAGLAAVAAGWLAPAAARGAAGQDWPAFVLVAGLLLVGLVVEADGLFAAAGGALARRARSGAVLYGGAVLLVAGVTAVLNLDTSVAFLTPVLVHAARSRGERAAPYLYGCLLLSNAASLLLPGSNLTNLIVLGHLHATGGAFAARMAAPFAAAVLLTAVVIALVHRRQLRQHSAPPQPVPVPTLGLGLAAFVAAVVLVIAAPQPAVPVFAVGAVAVVLARLRGAVSDERIWETVQAPTLVGLFGVAVAFGTVGRVWTAPGALLSSADAWATAGLGAGAALVINNLPAASLLGAHAVAHPHALLVGLDVGPNAFLTGSLAWLLWRRAALTAGERPSLLAAARLGLLATVLALPAAVGLLVLRT